MDSPPTPESYHPLMTAPPQGQWSTGLCDCMSDVPTCCLTCWCPWITFGQNAEIIDRGVSSCGVNGGLYGLIAFFTGGAQFIYGCTYRTKLKRQYGIPTTYIADGCTHLWCHPCALCQEHRELEHRGYDVPLGWLGNMEKLNMKVGVTSPPMAPHAMTR